MYRPRILDYVPVLLVLSLFLYLEIWSTLILISFLFVQLSAFLYFWIHNVAGCRNSDSGNYRLWRTGLSYNRHIESTKFTYAIFLLWYLTMMLPVNFEDKITLLEILFYHGLLILEFSLFRSLIVDKLVQSRSLIWTTPETTSAILPKAFVANSPLPRLSPPICNCFWLSLPITAANQVTFLIFLLVHLVYALYTTNLALTSICTPKLYWNRFVLPYDCSSIYADGWRALIYASSLHWLVANSLPILDFVYQSYALGKRHFQTSVRSESLPLV